MKKKGLSRFLSAFMAVVMLIGVLPVSAAELDSNGSVRFEVVDNSEVSASLDLDRQVDEPEEQSMYHDTEMVRVSILLSDSPVIELYSTIDICENADAMNYRNQLENRQEAMAAAISEQALHGKTLDVVWNLTLITNIISANVRYGQIEAIKAVPGVEDVVVETRYEPMVLDREEETDPDMATSSKMIGSSVAYLSGYTGAGSRVAVIDTGIDDDHQSFSAGGFAYSLSVQAELAGMDYEEYVASLNLLDTAEIASKLKQLHIKKFGNYTARDLYLNSKIAFAYNYVDRDLTINHDHDGQGGHGSHVVGIAAANAYVPDGEGGYTSALDSIFSQGVAPDAQIIAMKVFGVNGGAYDSDYMVAIEDAIILGADSVNLSLGSGSPGYSTNSKAEFQAILDNLANTDTVVTMSAGNSGGWADSANNMIPNMYIEDVSIHTGGSPGSFTNSLGTASVNNIGRVGEYFAVGDTKIIYSQSSYSNKNLTTLAGEKEYVFITGYGSEADFEALADVLEGRIAVCSRGGDLGFYIKANNAAANGAAAVVIYNNQAGTINMSLAGYLYTNPVVSISQAEGALMKNSAQRMETEEGAVYYLGTMEISTGKAVGEDGGSYIMSDFSSWGVPGSLKMKPEITAPGGGIYSIDGVVEGGKGYMNNSGTSMAAPQIAGMAAIVAQYIRENDLAEQTGLSVRALSQSLLMSTAEPMIEEDSDSYYPVLRQGAGLANVGNAVSAKSYILMNADATESYADGKIKAELGDDPARTGEYSFSFTINNMTDEALEYELSAEIFTQDAFMDYTNPNRDIGIYMDTWTMPLYFDAAWTVNGTAAADLANVPANGSVEVGVLLTIDPDDMDYLDDYYTSGAYIEGYVFATPVVTDEGDVGVEHSIPVLAFYGDWTDASMYDVGTWTTVAYGIENRLSYTGATFPNYVTVQYASEGRTSYYFGGNPLFYEEYKPERNAINAQNGDKMNRMGYTLIRNAVAGQVTIEKEDGTEVYKSALGGLSAAYYAANAGKWQNTSNRVSLLWDMSNTQEGESYSINLSMATEYSRKADGSIDWDALGAGATLSLPFVIDNTAPVLQNVAVEDDTIIFTTRDNQYIAAIVIATADGTEYVGLYSTEQEEAGEVFGLRIDGSELEDGVYLLQVYDYAMNCTTYRLFFNITETDEVESVTISPAVVELVSGETAKLRANVLPFNLTDMDVVWSTSDSSVATVNQYGFVTAVAEGICTITATSVLDGSKSGTAQINVITIDYELNGILWDEEANIYWTSFNTSTLPSYSRMKKENSPIEFISATYDENGVLYAADINSGGESTLYTIDPANGYRAMEIGGTDVPYTDLTQAPSLDNVLVGVFDGYLLIIDKESGDYYNYYEYCDLPLVGVAYIGSEYHSDYQEYADLFALIDIDGNVYQQGIMINEDSYRMLPNTTPSVKFTIDADVISSGEYGSAYYDGEYLYWSVYDENEGVNKLYAANMDTGVSHLLGNFGEDVWPVGGLFEFSVYDLVNVIPERETGCKHNDIVYVPAKAATTTADGNIAHWFCGECDKYFSDVRGRREITKASTIIPKISSGAVVENPSDGSTTTPPPTGDGGETATPVETAIDIELITTPEDAPAVVGEDGSITLPGGGSIQLTENVTIEAPVDTVIDADGNVTIGSGGAVIMAGDLELSLQGNTVIVLDESSALGYYVSFVNPFTDVSTQNWFFGNVGFAYSHNLFQGTGNNQFSPNTAMTRGMLATVLARLDGADLDGYQAGTFADVAAGQWYTEAVEWAAELGIAQGDGTNFMPNSSITREQLAVMLYNYANATGYDLPVGQSGTFSDAADIHTWAAEAVAALQAAGIISGRPGNLFDPQGSATRAEVAAMLQRFIEYVIG